MHIFLDDNINNDIYDGLPNEDNQNSINDDAKIFIDNLKEIFKKRIGELTKQYYMNYNINQKIKLKKN